MPAGGSATGKKIHQGNIPLPSGRAGVVRVYPPTVADGKGLVFAPDGSEISTAGSTTSGLQEAIDYADDHDCDLQVIGGGEEDGGGVVYQIASGSTLDFPPMQGKYIEFGACTLNFAGSGAEDCITFDSCLLVNVQFRGQIVSSRAGKMVHFYPRNFLPQDQTAGKIVGDSYFFFAHLAGVPDEASTTTNAVVFDCSQNNISGFNGSRFEFIEVNGGSDSAVLVTTPAGTTSFFQNRIECGHIHGLTGTAWALKVGESSTTKITNNMWIVHVSDATATTKGISTYATQELYIGSMNSAISANGFVFQSSADQNVAILRQWPGGITDSSTTKQNLVMTAAAFSDNAVSLGASPFAYQNTSAREETIVVDDDGTITAIDISVNGSTWRGTGAATSGVYRLRPGEYLRFTYSAAPTVRALRNGT